MDEGSDTKKRKIYDDDLSESGPLTQEDVKYFRKQAIWRQMKYYKEKFQINELSLQQYELKLNKLSEEIEATKSWKTRVMGLLNKQFDTDEQLVEAINDILSNGLDDESKQKVIEKSQVVDQLSSLQEQNEVLRATKDDLLVKIDEMTSRLLKHQARLTSDLVNRVFNEHKEEIKEETKDTTSVAVKKEDLEDTKDLKRQVEEYERKLKEVISEKESLKQEIGNTVEVIKIDNGSTIAKKSEADDEISKQNEVIANLTKQVNDYQLLINNELIKENDTLKELLKKNETDLVRIRNVRDDLLNKVHLLESVKTNDKLVKLNEELQSKIDTKFNSDNEIIKDLEESYKKLVTDFHVKVLTSVEQENLVNKYKVEKVKADQKYFQIMKLKDNLVNENKLLKLTITKSSELIDKFNKFETKHQEKISKLIEVNEELKQQLTHLKNDNKKLLGDNNAKNVEINKLVTKFSEVNDQIKQLKQDKIDIQIKANEKDAELVKLNRFKKAGTNSNDEELNGYRTIIRCSVCSKNWKDTVITVCGHVFCNQCAKERLDARLRRCPTCNKGFSGSDLLSIHL